MLKQVLVPKKIPFAKPDAMKSGHQKFRFSLIRKLKFKIGLYNPYLDLYMRCKDELIFID